MWKPVVGFEDTYEVSIDGLVRRTGRNHGATVGRLLKQKLGWGGYPAVILSRSGEQYKAFIHRLVACAFIGPCPMGKEVNHKDRNRLNPTLDNLEYVTRTQNIHHSIANGGYKNRPWGEAKTGHKLTWEAVRAIRASAETQRSLAARYGVCHKIIGNIKHGVDWPRIEAALL